MSNFAGHRNAGILASAVVGGGLVFASKQYGLPLEEIVIPAASTFIFSLFPDIDVKSTPSKFFYACILTVLGYCYYTQQHAIGNLIGLFAVIPQVTKHRGIFHHPITALLLPSAVFYLHYLNVMTLRFAVIVYLASVFGYFVHLFKDKK